MEMFPLSVHLKEFLLCNLTSLHIPNLSVRLALGQQVFIMIYF